MLFINKDLTIRAINPGLAILDGGYGMDENGRGGARVLNIWGPCDPSAYAAWGVTQTCMDEYENPVVGPPTVVLEGLQITNGNTDDPTENARSNWGGAGGGVKIRNAVVSFIGCEIYSNHAKISAGGVSVSGNMSVVYFRDSLVSGNEGSHDGRDTDIYVSSSSSVCHFGSSFGAIYSYNNAGGIGWCPPPYVWAAIIGGAVFAVAACYFQCCGGREWLRRKREARRNAANARRAAASAAAAVEMAAARATGPPAAGREMSSGHSSERGRPSEPVRQTVPQQASASALDSRFSGQPGFVPTPDFRGNRPGYVYRAGPSGVGYYRDGSSQPEPASSTRASAAPTGAEWSWGLPAPWANDPMIRRAAGARAAGDAVAMGHPVEEEVVLEGIPVDEPLSERSRRRSSTRMRTTSRCGIPARSASTGQRTRRSYRVGTCSVESARLRSACARRAAEGSRECRGSSCEA